MSHVSLFLCVCVAAGYSSLLYAQENQTHSPPQLEEILLRLKKAEDEVVSLRKELTAMKGERKNTATHEEFSQHFIDRGKKAFEINCTQCHDSSRALKKQKTFSMWLKTVRKMSQKFNADIPEKDHKSIAAYLTSHQKKAYTKSGGVEYSQKAISAFNQEMLEQSRQNQFGSEDINFDLTISTVFRDSTDSKADLQNNGFTPDVWFGMQWHPRNSPLSVRVQSCVTCHSEGSKGSRIELVEAVSVLDLLYSNEKEGVKAHVQAGRFIVPFGAIASKVHPATMQTVTRPLMYDMGHGVHRNEIGPSVLPMPYSDEGAMVHFATPIIEEVNATFDAYLVNGLQGDSSGLAFFYDSRDYVDNNSQPAFGGRATVGSKSIRLGGSYMTGQFNDAVGSGLSAKELDYQIIGADLTVRHQDLIRFQAEFAMRYSDRIDFSQALVREDHTQGINLETQIRLLEDPPVSLIARYDMIEQKGDLPPITSSLSKSEFSVDRMTWGFSFGLPGGSGLILSHEHWKMPGNLEDVDVFGGRWTVSY